MLKCILALAVLVIGAISMMTPAEAQTYDPDFPVCRQIFGPFGYYDCSYTSMSQCRPLAQGLPAQCIVNPYYDKGRDKPLRPYHRRRHRAE